MSHTPPLMNPEPDAMTRRARWYLAIGGTRHLVLGVFAIAAPWLFQSAAFIPILDFLPLWAWGGIMCAVGVTCAAAAYSRNPTWARVGMVGSATVTVVLGAGVLVGVVFIYYSTLNPASPLLPTLLLSLAAKDYVVCAQPIRSPFESVLNRTPEVARTVT